VRVPALVIGPRVARGVNHVQFDHTTLIKTILLRFAQNPEQAIAAMGPRVQAAQHLGVLLQAEPSIDIAKHDTIQAGISQWRQQARIDRAPSEKGASTAPDGAGQQIVLNDFQREFFKLATELRKNLPPGMP
jgi:hypothetical protein